MAMMLQEAFSSPNESMRFHVFERLKADPFQKKPIKGVQLADYVQWMASQENERTAARAIWLYLQLPGVDGLFEGALTAKSPNLRITALRALRQKWQGHPERVLDVVEKLVDDPNPQVRRECALALRFYSTAKATEIWAHLARRYAEEAAANDRQSFGDRWQLEALGIGAHTDALQRTKIALRKTSIPDLAPIAFRLRDNMNLIAASHLGRKVTDNVHYEMYLRALDFHPESPLKGKQFETIFLEGDPIPAIYAAGKLGPDAIAKIEGGPARLDTLLAPIRGTAEFVRLAERLNLRGFDDELAAYIAKSPSTNEAVSAARILLRNRKNLLTCLSDNNKIPQANAIITALGRTGDRALSDIFGGLVKNPNTPAALKPAIINAMAGNGRAGQQLLDIATQKDSPLDDSLKAAAALAFARSPDKNLREDAARRLPVPKAAGAENFPPLADLLKLKGDAKKGQPLFATATCNTCHKVAGEGIDFGPDLSEIGTKLGRDAMFEAILYPSAAISHGFHGVGVTTKDGTALIGYATGETDSELQLRLPGGVDQSVTKKDIQRQDTLEQSLMPPGLAAVIGPQGLADLVSYLQSLK